ncbi:unnamed protein product [Camellia sinensis]
MAKRLIPSLNRVLVEKIIPPSKTNAGILLPEKTSKLNSGKVVAVGPGIHDRDGKLIPVSVKEGETVLLPEYGGTEVKLGEKDTTFWEHCMTDIFLLPIMLSHTSSNIVIVFLLVRLLQNRKPYFPERNNSLQSFHMDPEAARTARESLDLAFHMSNILDTGLDRHTLSVLIALCDLGQNPEALAAVVKELRREPSSSSPMPTSSSSVQ